MRRAAAFLLLLSMFVTLVSGAAKPPRTSKAVKRDRQRTEQQIARTRAEIKKNDEETRRQLNRLNSLQANIDLKNDTIRHLNVRLDSIKVALHDTEDSIRVLTARADALKKAYAASLRAARSRRQGMTDLAFIFSAESFSQAWRRVRYLRETARAGAAQARRVQQARDDLNEARMHLQALHEQQAADIGRIDASRRRLAAERSQANVLVAVLRRQGRSLDRELKRRRDQAAALDRELNRVIEQEIRAAEERRRREEAERAAARAEAEKKAREEAARKAAAEATPAPKTPKDTKVPKVSKDIEDNKEPKKAAPAPKATAFANTAAADRALTGGFAANKGRLLFPVPGRYTITSNFGTNTHPELAKVKIDNLGIDIEVPPGTGARAVYEGVVSSIFRLEGYHNIVIVRHGEYLTVYGGLDRLAVRKGDKVRTGQSLGTIHSDAYDDNRTRLHFEIRREKQKLNPVEWVR